MFFPALDEEKTAGAQRMAPSSDDRFAATRENVEPLIRAAMAVVSAAFLVARREHHLGRLGGAVAGDYAESPAEPQLLPDQLACYLVVLPVPVLGVDGDVVLLPELEPVDGAVGAAGLVVLDELPMPELDEPEPALLRSSRRQVSRWAPVRPVHLLASLPDAPDAAPVPDVLLGVLVSLELEDEAPEDGSVLLLPEDEPAEGADGEVMLLPDEPMPVLPLLEPEDWANAAPDSARSAAAVAAVRVFNIMREISFEG